MTSRRLFLLALSGSLLFGCGGGSSQNGDGSPQFISIGTAPQGGAFYQVGSAIANKLNDRKDEVGWKKVTAESTGGSLENLRRLESDEVQLGMSNSSITYFAVRGEGGFDHAYDVKSAMTLFPLVAMFVTREGAGIDSIADLEGERVVIGPEGAGFEYFVEPILEAHGVALDDLDVVYAGMTTSVGYLQDESVAATFLGGGMKSPAITSAATTMNVKLVPYDEGARKELVEKYPSFNEVVVPAGTYKGQDEDFQGLNVGSAHLLVRSDADDDFVYNVARLIYEQREELAQIHAAAKAINENNVVRNTGTEFHPGAIKFYREAGLWKADGESSDGGQDEKSSSTEDDA